MFNHGDRVVSTDGLIAGKVAYADGDMLGVLWDDGVGGFAHTSRVTLEAAAYEYGIGEYAEDAYGFMIEWLDGTRDTAEEYAERWASFASECIYTLVRRPVDYVEVV